MSSPHFQAAVRLRQLRRFDQAEAELKLHLASEPDDAAAYAELALCLKEEERRLPEALAAIERAVGLDPEEPGFLAWRCFILCQMERGEEALAAAHAAISMDPEFANGWVEQSRAYHVLRRWKDSEASARKALALAPENSVALNLLSSALQMQGNSHSGIGVAEQLLARDPEEPYAHANMGWAKLRQQNYKEAEAHFREALRLEPGVRAFGIDRMFQGPGPALPIVPAVVVLDESLFREPAVGDMDCHVSDLPARARHHGLGPSGGSRGGGGHLAGLRLRKPSGQWTGARAASV
jgi:tetratricopeptide (TPR) repeat protein